jgi:hypothetical protein
MRRELIFREPYRTMRRIAADGSNGRMARVSRYCAALQQKIGDPSPDNL